eukprot:jgi/Mesen1/667/ME000109S10881
MSVITAASSVLVPLSSTSRWQCALIARSSSFQLQVTRSSHGIQLRFSPQPLIKSCHHLPAAYCASSQEICSGVREAGRSVCSIRPSTARSQPHASSRASSCRALSVQSSSGLAARVSRRLLAQYVARGLLGLMALEVGLTTGTPVAMARAKVSEAEEVLKSVDWPQEFPFKEEDFSRYDESVDTDFYATPRFVTHIDDPAIAALSKHYAATLPPANTEGVAILDMCSSWISHYPKGYKQSRIVGLGLNEAELKKNEVLTEYTVQDLNVNPKLPYEDNSFDVITNVVSVDYLSKPLEIFKEMNRVLKPGGLAIMSFSNRCFWTKAIQIWTSTGDVDHCWIVGSYFHYAGGFEPPQALDISPNPGRSDPMYIVYSRKLAA